MQIMRVGQAILPNEAKGCVQQAIGGANPRRQVRNACATLVLGRCVLSQRTLRRFDLLHVPLHVPPPGLVT